MISNKRSIFYISIALCDVGVLGALATYFVLCNKNLREIFTDYYNCNTNMFFGWIHDKRAIVLSAPRKKNVQKVYCKLGQRFFQVKMI